VPVVGGGVKVLMLEHQPGRLILVSHSSTLVVFFCVCLFSEHCLVIEVELFLVSQLDEMHSCVPK